MVELGHEHRLQCPVCGKGHEACGPPIGAALMATVTSQTIPDPRRAKVGNIIVQQNVYRDQPDGRTVLVAVANEEITEARAAELGIGKDGKAKDAGEPATTLRRQPRSAQEQAVGSFPPAPPVQPGAPPPEGASFDEWAAYAATVGVDAADYADDLEGLQEAVAAKTGQPVSPPSGPDVGDLTVKQLDERFGSIEGYPKSAKRDAKIAFARAQG